jgi:hypothetical protein
MGIVRTFFKGQPRATAGGTILFLTPNEGISDGEDKDCVSKITLM